MSTDRDVTRIVRSWLDEGVTALPDRVLDSVLDQVPATPQRRAGWPAWRFPRMNSIPFRLGIAAAAVIAIAILAINLTPIGNLGQGPTPTPIPDPTATPRQDAQAVPADFVLGDPFAVNVSAALGDGWGWWTPTVGPDAAAIYRGSFDPPAGMGIVFAVPDHVTDDPCGVSASPLLPPLGLGVADLADALAGQPNTEVAERSAVTLDGYSGEYLDYSFSGSADCPRINRWNSTQGSRQAIDNERDQVWILDVDGTRLVIDVFSFPQASPADLAEIRQIVEAMQIDPR